MKQIRYRCEAVFLWLLFNLFRILPLDTASALGGFLLRLSGPHLAVSRKALRHISRAFPHFNEEQKKETLRAMWDNLGRIMAELPHLQKICAERVELVNKHILDALPPGRAVILYGAHLANWEIFMPFANNQMNIPLTGIYREPNNPYVARMLSRIRDPEGKIGIIPKSRRGARDTLRILKNNQPLGILIDQKYNEGIPVSFFGHDAMTSPAFVELGQKFNVPVIGARIERLQGAHFRMTIHEPLTLFTEDGAPLPAASVITTAHILLEEWIRAHPGQWLWLHRRWPHEKQEK